jgi:uncharacterized protein (DUF1697 family)
MARLVALLRGINLGSKRRVPMADLRELLEELGYEDVRTVLQSGNVVFTGPKAKARQKLEDGLQNRYGFKVDVVLRTMKELHEIVDAEPFGDEADNLSRYFVVFLPSSPSAKALDVLKAQDFAPDKFETGVHELYAWCPRGMQDSGLMRALGKPGLAETATVRNMATVKKLLE